MPYVSSSGEVGSSRSPWRISIISDTFWAIINFIVLFFQTMFSPNLTKHGSNYTSDYRPGDGPGGPQNPRRRMGRINNGGGGGPSSPGNLPPGGG
ncbi:selenoprotein K-like [Clytia hemisphaerica]|uniref:selenoprotein K-like n=1 Tax=Clytia hemisphaerica TaxID=252671 RepID=UPI0034D7A9E3